MREKLLDLMKSEGLRPSQLAEMLDINPAGISHILAGRNKPGFDLLQKILTRFPRVNPDWLMLDSPNMYRDDSSTAAPRNAKHQTSGSDDLFGAAEFSQTVSDVRKSLLPGNAVSDSPTSAPSSSSKAGEVIDNFSMNSSARSSSAQVRRVVVFYDDQTFESFDPAKK